MSIQAQKFLISVDDYHKMGEAGILPERGVELINGEIFEMSPIGSKHASVVDRINRLLSKLLDDNVILRIQNPVILSNFSEPEPDIAIVGYKEDFYESSHPRAEEILLIIEVCDSSILYDRQVKLPLYAQNGIPECWLVDLEKKEIQAFWQPIGEAYRFSQLGTDADILSAQNIPLKVPVKKIFS
ncbi:MAG: Uma2 family endonuclease [Lewinella sp.]|nr:Uma2 family endonuclease [Lewinella sp.]